MNAQEIIDFIANAEKKTPVKVYVNTTDTVDFGSAQVFGSDYGADRKGGSYVVFGDWKELGPILEANAGKIADYVVENDCRNSAVPLLDLKGVNARIEPGAIIRDKVEIGDGAVIMMGAILNIGAVVGKGTMIDMGTVLGGRATVGDRCHIGAGTVLTVKQVEDAAAAGAEFMISPNTNVDVIRRTKELGLLSLPGAYTPTEAELAWESGADIVKIFPASGLGPAYFKAVKSSLSQLRLSAVGGVSEQNIHEFLAAGVDSFGIGNNLVSAERVARGAWQEIEAAAAFYTAAVKG